MGENTQLILKDLDENNISSLLKTYHEINSLKKELENEAEKLKDKIKMYLKERKWTNYKDDNTKISISIIPQKKESVNKNMLKMLLNDEQYNQVITTSTFEKILILTKKDKERIQRQFKK